MATLRKIERAAAANRSTRDKLALEIQAGRNAGLSLREIAKAAGMSHEQVRRLTQ